MFASAIFLTFLTIMPSAYTSSRHIRFANRCHEDIWISPLTNNAGATLSLGIVHIKRGGHFTYKIPSSGWDGRFWPKMGCDTEGNSCQVGQSLPPCPSGGCDPSAETKVDFFFPPFGDDDDKHVRYDIDLVDGYSIAVEVIPTHIKDTCRRTNCAMSLDKCPVEEKLGDLKVRKNGKTVQCLSPCKKWNSPHPIGFGRPKNQGSGLRYCCPTPTMKQKQCHRSLIARTKYVDLVRRECPSAYSYSHDDEAGGHNCSNEVNFLINFC